jgi:endo-1,3(4)-beta-glucanase
LERDGHPTLLPFPTVISYPFAIPEIDPSDEESDPSDSPSSSTSEIDYASLAIPQVVPVTGTVSDQAVTAFPSVSPTPSISDTDTEGLQGLVTPAAPSASYPGIPSPTQKINDPLSTMAAQDAFQPVSVDPIPKNVQSRDDHPVPKLGIVSVSSSGETDLTDRTQVNTTGPVDTNKFHAGFFLGNRSSPTFTHPYSISWAQGTGAAASWGMAISHTDADMLAFGPPNPKIPGSPASHYINPLGIQPMILSAAELGKSTALNVEQPTAFSAQIILRPQNGSSQSITFPVVQGMGYVTGVYSGLQPIIQSGVFFQKVVSAGFARPGVFKYRVTLEDNKSWLVYVTPANGTDPDLKLESNTLLRGPSGFSGTIQVCKNPAGDDGEKFFDNSAGVYPVTGNITGSVSNSTGTYSLNWEKAGKDASSSPLLMFALPHHVESFDDNTRGRKIALQLRTTTKGNATAVIGESWTMVEPDLPVDMEFAPWSSKRRSIATLTSAMQQAVRDVASTELKQSMDNETNLDSMYYSGKALSKFATLVYTVHTLANDPQSAATALNTLKTSFARFVDNKQKFPLVYDNVWKGVVSSASYVTKDPGVDFGNSYYNDHHFHYGYFIHAASIIGALDPSWIDANKAWVNMLVRDAGNSVTNDAFFPFSRAFDWFHGHSWAKGLFESWDGKDQESTSEDVLFAYAVKMWGHTIGDKSMEARGNLMLGLLKRSLRNYFLMESTNTNQPAQFIGNKVTGIVSVPYDTCFYFFPLADGGTAVRKQG